VEIGFFNDAVRSLYLLISGDENFD